MELELIIGTGEAMRRVANRADANAIANRVQRAVKDAIVGARKLKPEDVTTCVLTCDGDFAVNSVQLPKAASTAVRAAFEAPVEVPEEMPVEAAVEADAMAE